MVTIQIHLINRGVVYDYFRILSHHMFPPIASLFIYFMQNFFKGFLFSIKNTNFVDL